MRSFIDVFSPMTSRPAPRKLHGKRRCEAEGYAEPEPEVAGVAEPHSAAISLTVF
jgi:hypothetical protein